MRDEQEIDRDAHIRALIVAARLERALTMRRLLGRLFRRRGTARAWRSTIKQAVGDCR